MTDVAPKGDTNLLMNYIGQILVFGFWLLSQSLGFAHSHPLSITGKDTSMRETPAEHPAANWVYDGEKNPGAGSHLLLLSTTTAVPANANEVKSATSGYDAVPGDMVLVNVSFCGPLVQKRDSLAAERTGIRALGESGRNTLPLTPEQIQQVYQHVQELGLNPDDF